MRIGLGIGVGAGGKPAPGSLAQFTSAPTVREIQQGWNITWGEERVTISAYPTISAPIVTWGVDQVTITG